MSKLQSLATQETGEPEKAPLYWRGQALGSDTNFESVALALLETPRGSRPVRLLYTLLDDIAAGRDSKRFGLNPIPLEQLVDAVAIKVSEAEFISTHSGVRTGNFSMRRIYPYLLMGKADRLDLLHALAVEGCQDRQKLWFREEKDLISELPGGTPLFVPKFRFWGIWVLRALVNFPLEDGKTARLSPHFIRGVLRAKKIAWHASKEDFVEARLTQTQYRAMGKAIDTFLAMDHETLLEHFPIAAIQGGAGTSMNMMINEGIANLTNRLLREKARNPKPIHTEHPNLNQSTNDVIPAGFVLGILEVVPGLLARMTKEVEVLGERARAIAARKTVALAQTEGQDAVLVLLSRIFEEYRVTLSEAIAGLAEAFEKSQAFLLGGTAIGEGQSASRRYLEAIPEAYRTIVGREYRPPKDFLAATRDGHPIEALGHALGRMAGRLLKIVDDLWDKTRVKEITHPRLQGGSSIMPGKINPVLIELVQQLSRKIKGNVFTIERAMESYASRISSHLPLVADQFFSGLQSLSEAWEAFHKLIQGLEVNETRIAHHIEGAPVFIVTAVARRFPQCGHTLGDKAMAHLLKAGVCNAEILEMSFREAAREVGLPEEDVVRALHETRTNLQDLAAPHASWPLRA